MVALLALVATACSESAGEFPLISRDAAAAGTKMLRPAARAEACRTRLFGRDVAGEPAPLDQAVRALFAMDAEADALANVRITTRATALGIGDHTCVTVQGDVVRTISVVRLPAPPGHEGHH